ncbi:unnamed protein product [Amoebophrya sp. A25]|nr:unnamed protein product [Amoebophrya sp. A25]|eukprot:GSA25T00008681001.1
MTDKDKPAAELEDGKKAAGEFDFQKSYARRRNDEPKSHYNARLKFIHALLKAEGHIITDEKIEVLSHCFSNVKYLRNKYPDDIMAIIAKYDPTRDQDAGSEPAGKRRKVDSKDSKEEGSADESNKEGEEKKEGKAAESKENAASKSPARSNGKAASNGGSPETSPKAGAKSAAALLAAAAEDSD